MIYDVTLKIASDYPAAVKDARHVLRIRLRDGVAQTTIAQSLKVLPLPDEHTTERDFYGNGVDHLLLRRAHDRLVVEMRARVRVGVIRLRNSGATRSGLIGNSSVGSK